MMKISFLLGATNSDTYLNKMKELTVGMTIKFDNGSDECFVIDKIFPGNIVDMTATKSRIEWMPDLREKFIQSHW